MEPATVDRVQRMIDAEAAERFPPDAVPMLAPLGYGDHPVIEPGELYLQVFLDRDGAARRAWMEEYFDRLADLRAQRLPEVKGFILTANAPGSGDPHLTNIMKVDGISLFDPEEDGIARGLTPLMARLGLVDVATLDTLITAGIASSRAEVLRWALARVREQPAYARLGEQARASGETRSAVLDQTVPDQWRSRLDERVREHFPDGDVRRAALLEYGDDPWIEPGGLLVRVFVEEAEGDPHLPTWERDRETAIDELQRELEEELPGVGHLEFWFGENGHQGKRMLRLGSPPADPDRLTPVDLRLGPADLAMLDALITTGTAASRAEAIGWVLARVRERPAYARLSERARELDELKAHF